MIPCIVGETGSLEAKGAGKAMVAGGTEQTFLARTTGRKTSPQEWGRSPTAEHTSFLVTTLICRVSERTGPLQWGCRGLSAHQ